MAYVTVVSEVDPDDLGVDLARSWSREDLKKLVLSIDEAVCDCDFTKELRAAIDGVLDGAGCDE